MFDQPCLKVQCGALRYLSERLGFCESCLIFKATLLKTLRGYSNTSQAGRTKDGPTRSKDKSGDCSAMAFTNTTRDHFQETWSDIIISFCKNGTMIMSASHPPQMEAEEEGFGSSTGVKNGVRLTPVSEQSSSVSFGKIDALTIFVVSAVGQEVASSRRLPSKRIWTD